MKKVFLLIGLFFLFCACGSDVQAQNKTNSLQPEKSSNVGECVVKANINSKGKKYYSFEGCKNYESTVIKISEGEQCFPTPEAAKNAGWTVDPYCPKPRNSSSGSNAESQSTARKAPYILSLTWYPSNCEINADSRLRECNSLTGYQKRNLALHGLWVQVKGVKDGKFCGRIKTDRPFSQYPKIDLTDKTKKALAKMMPAYAVGNHLELAEFWGHGTCTGLNAEAYYQQATSLTEKLNGSSFGAFMRNNAGKSVSKSALKAAADNAFGKDASSRFELICVKGHLLYIYVHLSEDAGTSSSLKDLILGGNRKEKDKCGDILRIAD